MAVEHNHGFGSLISESGAALAIGIAAFLALAALWIAATPEGRVAWRTALFIPQVVGSLPVNPQPWVMGTPDREEVFYGVSSGLGSADLYTPAGDGVHSGVLLFLGCQPGRAKRSESGRTG